MPTTPKEVLPAVLARLAPHLTIQKDGEPDAILCCWCGAKVTRELSFEEGYNTANVRCDACKERERQARLAKVQAHKEQKLREALLQLPPLYRDTEPEKIPCQVGYRLAMAWTYQPKGLLLYGATGLGKTRAGYQLALREILAGKSFRAIDAHTLAGYPALLAVSTDLAQRYTNEVVDLDLVLLDDIFKAKITERVEEMLFAIVERRATLQKPNIITANDTGSSLQERLSPDRGPAFIRRLREFSTLIHFSV